MKQVNFELALHRLAAYCSRAERCVYDIRQKMTLWELSENDQKKILQSLQSEKFLDEQRFCRAFVNDKSKFSHWGAYKIKYALKNKQIPTELIDEALQIIDPQANREQLRQLLEKKRKTVKGANDYEIQAKLMRFAAGRGFSPDDIEAVLN
ncbi:regulatory protein RecX [Bacteroidia bacterium]|nr:regulatory protein RecX [Bacteroidia bacterium]